MSKSYDFYIDKCRLPVAPASLTITTSSGNRVVSLINMGEINLLSKPKLKTVEFCCLIPQVKYPFGVYESGYRPAEAYVEYFEKLQRSEKPFQFIVSRSMPTGKRLFSTNIKVSMEDISVIEDWGSGFDVTVKIKLKQYKTFSVSTVKTDGLNSGSPSSQRAPSTVQPVPASIGCNVIVNGRLYGSSYGEAPGQTRTNYRGKINYINPDGSHPYHITTPDGLWQGWVTKDSVEVVT